jgi:tetratricopeptide (TPR) repeat protein
MDAPSSNRQRDFASRLRRALRAHQQGELAKAERLYTELLIQEPAHFDVLHGLGQINYQRGRLEAALSLIQAALKTDLSRAEGFASLGLVFYSLAQHERALASYDEGLRIAPGNAELLNRRGVAFLELGRADDALASFDLALAAEPKHLDALGNRGNALLKLNRVAEALAAYDRALTFVPENAALLANRAVALRRLDRPQEAVMSATRALRSRPGFAHARFVEGVARLTLGDFSAGWRGYEARALVGEVARKDRGFGAPLWLGEQSLAGKTILLHAEQGFGDTIQFVRYAPLIAKRGARIVLEVQRELTRLLSCLPGIPTLLARNAPLPHFDFHCPLLSLPLACATELATIPAEIPYLAATEADVALWRERLPAPQPRIGLAWSGTRTHDNDLNRSLRLQMLAPLLDLPAVSFVSLQHEVREEDAAFLEGRAEVVRIAPSFRDFADTAAVIASLDAVVSVDTAIAHLAGAMGTPLFLLLPFAADFRWLRERRVSPWYPTARLYRQPAFGDWASAIDELRADLAEFSRPCQRLAAG